MIERDLKRPESSFQMGEESLSKGWDFNAHRILNGIGGGMNESVFKACSSSVHHGNGWEKTSSQRPKDLFSTEKLATMALLEAVEADRDEKISTLKKRITELS